MAATEQYKVQANLEVGADKVAKGLDAVIGRLKGIQGGVQRVNFGFDGLLTRAIAVGAAYFSFQAVTRGALNLAGGILAANANAEALQASLATVYAAVEKVSFADATRDSASLYRTLQKVAIESVATADELMAVFQGVYGPLRRGGLTLQEIVTTTNNAAVAAAALGVDFAQASRDISAMARGTAGLDVKTFSLLQSMGLITETTEQWNKLAPEKRAHKLMEVMSKIGGQAAEAYGKTWKGLSSTFVDLMGAFKRAFGSAVFERMKATLAKVNEYLLKNRERIEAYLTALGEKVGAVFDRIVNNAGATFSAVVANIDAIEAKVREVYALWESLKPTLILAAKVAVTMNVAAAAFNALVPAINALLFVVQGVMTVAAAVSAAMAGGAGIGGLIAAMSSGLAAFGAAVAAVALPLVIFGAVVAAIILGVMEFGDSLKRMLGGLWESAKSIAAQLAVIFAGIWAVLRPVLAFVGGVLLAGIIGAVRVFAMYIDKWVLPKFRILGEILQWVGTNIIKPVFEVLGDTLRGIIDFFEDLMDAIETVTDAFADLVAWVEDKISSVTGGGESWSMDEIKQYADVANVVEGMLQKQGDWRAAQKAAEAARREAERAAREKRDKEVLGRERSVVHNDFRGSKITVNQEFKEADPDNVWVQFRDGLEREAVARTRSGYVDPLAK